MQETCSYIERERERERETKNATCTNLASSMRSVSQRAARKTAREKNKESAASSHRAFFSRTVFPVEPQLTERHEEAITNLDQPSTGRTAMDKACSQI